MNKIYRRIGSTPFYVPVYVIDEYLSEIEKWNVRLPELVEYIHIYKVYSEKGNYFKPMVSDDCPKETLERMYQIVKELNL